MFLLSAYIVLAGAATAPSHHLVRGQATGVRGVVVLRAPWGETLPVEHDGPFAFTQSGEQSDSASIRVAKTPIGLVCELRSSGEVGASRLLLTCRAEGPAALPVLPMPNARNVSPLLGRAILVLGDVMAQPPTGTFTLESRSGKRWVDTGLQASSHYEASTRRWIFQLKDQAFPPNRVLRVTVLPQGGVDNRGRSLASRAIVWTFATGSNPFEGKGAGLPKGGCKIDDDSKVPSARHEPCNVP